MRIFQMICAKTLKDKIKSELIPKVTSVKPFKDCLKTHKTEVIWACLKYEQKRKLMLFN